MNQQEIGISSINLNGTLVKILGPVDIYFRDAKVKII
jgi:hypothetical protein